MRIGEVAAATGVSVEAIRYYERLGLLRAAARTGAGYRSFDQRALRRVRFIRRAQQLGFTLAEIRELLALRANPRAPAAGVKALAESKLRDVEAKITDLERIRDAVLGVACTCSGEGTSSECPILDALEGR